MSKPAFTIDTKDLRTRARHHLEQGAVTDGYKADRETVLRLCNEALASELVCVLRYKRHAFTAKGLNADAAIAEFVQHAAEEQGHADMIAKRIVQLGGAPDFSPEGLADRSHSQYVAGDTVEQMIREDLVAERIGIDSYTQIIAYLGDADPTTRRMFEAILAVEEEHAEDLASLLSASKR